MPTGLSRVRELRRAERRSERRILIISAVFGAALFLLSLCIRYNDIGFISPATAARNLAGFFRLLFVRLFSASGYAELEAEIKALPYYADTVARFRDSLLMLVTGAVLALSGAVYQSVMRNPMAEPMMLGVQAGVNLGKVLLVFQLGYDVYSHDMLRFLYCYGFSFATTALVLIFGRLTGRGKTNVADMIIGGAVINRLISSLVMYARTAMDTDQLYIYQSISEKSYEAFSSFMSLGVFCLVALVCLLPIFLTRFAYNAISFDDSEAMTLGVSPKVLRGFGMLSGGILMTAAMIHCGNIGLISLMIPHLCRYLFGAEFRKLYYTSAFYGAIFLLISRAISSFIYLGDYEVPLGNVVSVVVPPVFLILLWLQKRGWE